LVVNQFLECTLGVSETTAVLPDKWKERLITVENLNTNGIKGLCLEPHDMAISKLVACREKDFEVCKILYNHGLLKKEILLVRLEQTSLDENVYSKVLDFINLL